MNTARKPDELIVEIWKTLDIERRLDRIDRYFDESYIRHSEEGDYTRDEFAAILGALHTGFPDLTSEVTDLVCEGNRVAYRWVSQGTHRGEYMGVPPTNRQVQAMGITISTFGEDGRLVEDWASWNKVSVLHALGIVPIS